MVFIQAQDISKKYCLDLKTSLKHGISDLVDEILMTNGNRNNLRDNEFWALNDVSFKVNKGDCIGLIGRNGAGKSSLLKLISGLIKPDAGKVEINGTIGALIDLNIGFLPVLTGRENIYLKSAILGIPRRVVDKKLDEIVNFSGVEKFIDMPVKSYSSGMKLRLGFSIAMQMRTDVLLIDEVLAVGDLSFRMKALNKLREHIDNGLSIVFVSHNLEQIANICNKAYWLDKGKLRLEGEVGYVCSEYEKSTFVQNSITTRDKHIENATVFKSTDSLAEIIDVKCTRDDPLHSQNHIKFIVIFDLKSTFSDLYFSFGIRTSDQRLVYGDLIDISGIGVSREFQSIDIVINTEQLLNGMYLFSCGLHKQKYWGSQLHVVRNVLDFVIDDKDKSKKGIANIKPEINIH